MPGVIPGTTGAEWRTISSNEFEYGYRMHVKVYDVSREPRCPFRVPRPEKAYMLDLPARRCGMLLMEKAGIVDFARVLGLSRIMLPRKSLSNTAKEYDDHVENMMHTIGKSIAFLHARGVYHGDLHAGNIMFDEEDDLHLIDFDRTVTANDAEVSDAMRRTDVTHCIGSVIACCRRAREPKHRERVNRYAAALFRGFMGPDYIRSKAPDLRRQLTDMNRRFGPFEDIGDEGGHEYLRQGLYDHMRKRNVDLKVSLGWTTQVLREGRGELRTHAIGRVRKTTTGGRA
jgi:serine/threonine protein kinase